MPYPYEVIRMFESAVADYAGSRFGIAVDSGYAAIFLSLKVNPKIQKVVIPAKTHISVPTAIINAGCQVELIDKDWIGEYRIIDEDSISPIIVDSCCRFRKGMYGNGEFRCLSFDARKHLPIGRGGMILTDNAWAASWLKQARNYGREDGRMDPEFIGWKFYMEADQAARGLSLIDGVYDNNYDLKPDYPDLRTYDLF
jgi:dTDP-4-amino-4,6-dideoxygalactose transaminase